jgi:hypothetical protein
MDVDRWRRISLLYHEARWRADEDRRAFLDTGCGGDLVLRQELDSLLADDTRADIFLAAQVDAADLARSPATRVSGIITPGATLGNYRIERLLGRGGMGAVVLAYDTKLHRHVALKMLDMSASDSSSGSRLLREARNAAALNHPHICTIHEVGEAPGTSGSGAT